jgi:hypothetical protein
MAKKLTSTKARKILHDKEVHGHPLTEQQRKFFGAIAGGAKPYKAQDGTKTCPPGFVNIEGKCFDRKSVAYERLYKYGIGYMDDTDTLVSSRMDLPEVVLKPKSTLDFLDKIETTPATRYAFDQLGKKYGFPEVKSQDEYVDKSSIWNPFSWGSAHYWDGTIYGDDMRDYFGELAHHIERKGQIKKWILNDLPAYIKGEDPYQVEGTAEHTAHEIVYPRIKEEFIDAANKYQSAPFYRDDPEFRKARMEGTWDNYVSPVKKKKDGGWLDKYNAPQAQNGIEGTMGGLTDKGFNYNGAWGGPSMQMGGNIMPAMAGANQTVPMYQMGGVLPGAVGFTYARTAGAAPANGPYAKKTKASAQDGEKVMKGKEYVEQWMNSPMYKQMLEKSAQGPELERISKGRISNLSVPTNVSTDIFLHGTGTLGQKQHRIRTMFNATVPERDEMIKILQTSVDNPKDKEAKRRAEEVMQPVVTGWNIGMNPVLKPGTLDYEATLAHEYGHTTDDPFVSKLPHQMSKKELMSQDLSSYIPKSDIEKMQSYYQGKVNDDFTKYVSKPQETRQYLTSLRYLGKTQGVYDPFTEKITPEQYKRIKPTEFNDPAGTLRNIYTDEQIIDMLNSISKKQNVSDRVSTAQNGQEMKYYQAGLDFKPKTISKNGGWLDKYDAPQAQDGDVLEYLKKNKTAPVVTKGKPLTADQQKRITAETLKRQAQRSKPLTTTNTREQAVERGRAENLRVIEENKEYDRQAMVEGKAAEATRENPNVPFTFPTGESKLWKDMDWRERQYVSGRNLGSMSRFNNWTDWINPITMIGEMGEGLATAPYMARETDSNLPYVAGIASPLLGGALGGLGTRNTGQFVNNIINPLAGMDFSSKELSSIPGTKTTSGLFGRSKPKVGIDEELGIAPSGVKSDRHISQDDIQSAFKKEADWLRSDEYLKRRIAATGENPIAVKKDIEKIISRSANTAVNVEKLSKNTLGTYTGSSNIIRLAPHLTKTQALATLDHEVKHAMSQLATTGRGSYSKYPTTTLGNIFTRGFSMPKHMAYLNQPWEQQVRKLRLLDFINESQGVPRGQKLTMENIQQLAEDIKPVTAKDPGGFFAPDFSNRYGDVEHGYISGLIEANEKLKFVPQNLLKMKFPFKLQRQSNQAIRQTLLDQLNKAYVVPGAVTAGTAAAVLGGESEQAPKQQDGGDIPVDPMGYWNPENVGGPVIIPSNIITMEGVDQPLIGVSDTGDVQYMEPGEDYEFDGEYVTEYPVAQGGKRVPITVSDPNDPRLKAYQDSLSLYNNMNQELKGKKIIGYDPADKKKSTIELIGTINGKPSYKRVLKSLKEIPLWNKFGDIKPLGNYKTEFRKEKQREHYIDGQYAKSNDVSHPIYKYKKPVQPVEYREPEPVVEKKAPLTDYFQGTPIYAPTPYHGSGAGAFVGYRTPQGDTVFVKPEDYERMGVPKYGREFIESQTKKQRNGGVNNADAQPLKKLDQLLNFTNYNKPTKGGWLDKYN